MNHYPAYAAGRLDPQAAELLDRISLEPDRPLSSVTVEEARAGFLRPAWLGAPREVESVRDVVVPGPGGSLRLRACLPRGGGRPLPVLVFFHGGGFVLGRLDEFDAFCTRLGDGAGCLVVSVDYRLAPEHRFPAAAEDAVAALRWVTSNARELGGDPSRIALAGDSAGANLALVAALANRDAGGPALARLVLLSPWVDLTCTETESFRLFGQGRWLSAESLRWYRDQYLPSPEDARLPNASPLLARDLGNLPPTLVLTAEFDVLRDQAEALSDRLVAAGNDVRKRFGAGMLHDFVILPGLFDRASTAADDVCAELRLALGAGS